MMKLSACIAAIVTAVVSISVSLSWIPAATAQSARVVKIVVPYPPGGGADVLARIVANRIGGTGGPTMVVENRPGAGTVIGTQDVVRAKPDGNTLLLGNNSSLLVPHLRSLDYNPLTSLTAICTVARTPTVVVVNARSPYRGLTDLLNAARASPGALTYAAAAGAVSHVSFEMLLHPQHIRMTLVPYNGTPPQVNAVLAGQVDAAFVDYPAAAAFIKAGRLRALAVASLARFAALPDVPTVAEFGFRNYEMELWYGFFAPARTPPPAIARLADWFVKADQSPDTVSRLAALGMQASRVCGADFAAYLHRQYDDYGRIIADANIKAE